MKNFIKKVGIVILGNAIFCSLIGLFFLVLIIIASLSKNSDTNSIKNNSILNIKLDKQIVEKIENEENISFLSQDEFISVHRIVNAINNAADNDNIKGLIVSMNFETDISYEKLDLIRNAIANFKKSKKPTFAYGEISSQKNYYLASICNKIYMTPEGYLDFRGFGTQVMFLKNTLDKLGVNLQIFYAGKFKSATEPLRLNKMSEENKIQTAELLQDIKNNVFTQIANERKITIQALDTIVNNLKTSSPQEAFENKIIDGVKYFDEVEKIMKDECSINSKNLEYTSIKTYCNELSIEQKGDVAVYIAEGEISDGNASTNGYIFSHNTVKDIRKLANDDDIKAVVLRISSPGGSALASSVILREIELLKKKKPVVVSFGEVAASGGYYIASCGSKIFAEKNTITGSIGVFSIIPNLKTFLEEKLGLGFDEVELNNHAVYNVNKQLESEEAVKIQFQTEKIYNTFKSVVAKSRNLTMEQVENVAQGRVWSGIKAKEIGLVDQIGDINDAIVEAAKIANCSKSYFFANKSQSIFEQLEMNLQSSSITEILKSYFSKIIFDKEYINIKKYLDLIHQKGIYTKMYYTFSI